MSDERPLTSKSTGESDSPAVVGGAGVLASGPGASAGVGSDVVPITTTSLCTSTLGSRVLPMTDSEIAQSVRDGVDLLFLNLAHVKEQCEDMKACFPSARIAVAVKANSTPGVLATIAEYPDMEYEAATLEEILLCLSHGIAAEKIHFTHTQKSIGAIRKAHELGVSFFTVDSVEEVEKIAEHAPGSKVMLRIQTANTDKDEDRRTGFNMRFGAADSEIKTIADSIREHGLDLHGLSFHVGTQQEDPIAWDPTIKKSALLFRQLQSMGFMPIVLDVGGGFPSNYKPGIPKLSEYATIIQESVARYFGEKSPQIMLEPGRFMSAQAGITIGEVAGIRRREEHPAVVTVSSGRFSAGLWGVGNDVQYYRPSSMGTEETAFVRLPVNPDCKAMLYGPACASFDTPFDNSVSIPADLQSGDVVVYTGTGDATAII